MPYYYFCQFYVCQPSQSGDLEQGTPSSKPILTIMTAGTFLFI